MVLQRFGLAISLLAGVMQTACAQPAGFTQPDQFLVDKETAFAAIVKIIEPENRWVILPDGDNLPLVVSQCEMGEILAGGKGWPIGTIQSVMQYDYSNLISKPIAPPAIDGRRYVLWAWPAGSQEDSEVPAVAPWVAHLLLIRRQGNLEFVFWNGKSYALSAIRQSLQRGRRLALDQIVDPAVRLEVARARLERGEIGDEKSFVRGLVVNVLDPDGQAKKVEEAPNADVALGDQAHELWYRSLGLL